MSPTSKTDFIRTTAGTILAAEEALNYLRGCVLPASASFKIAVLLGKIAPEFSAAHNTRIEIFRRFGKESNGRIECPPGSLAELTRALEPLASEPVEIQARKLPYSIFDGVKISPAHMLALMPFIEDEDD